MDCFVSPLFCLIIIIWKILKISLALTISKSETNWSHDKDLSQMESHLPQCTPSSISIVKFTNSPLESKCEPVYESETENNTNWENFLAKVHFK